jgi:general secretion pathway protein F
VLEFTRGMAALLPAGMPLSKALAASTSTSPASIQAPLHSVRERVQRGDELAAALGEHPDLFSPLYVGIIRAGEKSGALDGAFIRLTGHLEREEELRGKLLSMSIYPVALAVVGLASVLVLVLFVLPRFAEVLVGSGSPLPRSTALVLGIAEAAQQGWVYLLLVPVAFALALAWMRGTEAGQAAASRFLLSLPVVGTWRKQALAARFARMSGELLVGGSPLLSALRDTAECMGDPIARRAIDTVRGRVREGSTLTRAVEEVSLFPQELWQLVSLGEESGKLADFLLKAADLLERRTERGLERMVALAEPAVIIAFGGIVALVALSLLQAIYGVNLEAVR